MVRGTLKDRIGIRVHIHRTQRVQSLLRCCVTRVLYGEFDKFKVLIPQDVCTCENISYPQLSHLLVQGRKLEYYFCGPSSIC